ncbi:small membrane protein YmiC [Salmonella enterica subsp. enterica serovar Saphra]
MLTSNIKYWSWTGAFILSLLFWALDCRLISSKPDNALFIGLFVYGKPPARLGVPESFQL